MQQYMRCRCTASGAVELPSGRATHAGSCSRHISAAMSHACHMGCWCVGGSLGQDTGVQLLARMMRSARRKLRNRLATSRSCRADSIRFRT